MSEVSKLVNSRGRIKAKLTAFNTYLEKAATDSAKLAELPSRLERAVRLWDEFDGIQDQIEELDATDAQIRERENFENSYHAIITSTRALQSRQDRVNQSSPMGSISERSGGDRQIHIVNQPTIVKLPDIELPKFDGSYNKWISFRELFESLIDADPSLPAVKKLHYLRLALIGDAATIINLLEITGNNYVIAWNLLKQRYENKRLIVEHHL
ncbi:hypothetical protein ALC57_11770 [Trachymyrmex cornetzi]|uniref:Uncharacterized protein n=1 Tax=Trachymyrmex cornetzi TaxID=471704 RepID=A0A151J1X9_9HYME|nr:hypothetical protein ALC57_11770 [Trachymyrmex cornetzi]